MTKSLINEPCPYTLSSPVVSRKNYSFLELEDNRYSSIIPINIKMCFEDDDNDTHILWYQSILSVVLL